jgi:hypothetical protein
VSDYPSFRALEEAIAELEAWNAPSAAYEAFWAGTRKAAPKPKRRSQKRRK